MAIIACLVSNIELKDVYIDIDMSNIVSVYDITQPPVLYQHLGSCSLWIKNIDQAPTHHLSITHQLYLPPLLRDYPPRHHSSILKSSIHVQAQPCEKALLSLE